MATLNDLQTISSETISEETLNTNFSLLNEVALTGTDLSLDLIDTSIDPNPLIKLDIINDNFKKIKDNWIDTSDATATASDIASGVTAYVNGEKVSGGLPVHDENSSGAWANFELNYLWQSTGADHLDVISTATSQGILYSGGDVSVKVPHSEFGNATAADVASGKTFTSAAGYKVTGTASSGVGDVVPLQVGEIACSSFYNGQVLSNNGYTLVWTLSNVTINGQSLSAYQGGKVAGVSHIGFGNIYKVTDEKYSVAACSVGFARNGIGKGYVLTKNNREYETGNCIARIDKVNSKITITVNLVTTNSITFDPNFLYKLMSLGLLIDP